jgi:AraC-like DNA-binding protein
MYESGEHTLFVATGKHLYRLMLIGGQLEKVADLKDSPVDMCADNRGNVYLAMKSNGLCVVAENGKFERIDDKDEAFQSVACMADGTVWTSTYEGNVYKYVQGTWHLERETLLCSSDGSAVKCLRTDGLGHVWTLTDQCVCEYAPQSRAVRMIRNNNPFVNASYFSTLENIDQNHVGINGAGAIVHVQSSVELGQQTASNVQPRVASVLSDGRVYFIGRDESVLELDAEEQNITINLTTLDHLHADGICFAYQLEGVNDEWIYLPQGVNSIILTNLTKGSNMLRVIATDRYGCWSEPTAVLTIQRAPFWYETWWAYLLYGIAALLTGYGLFRLERRIQLLRGLIRRKREVRLDEIEMKREDVAVQQRDDTFLRQVVAKVEENLGRPDYNVEVLSEDMCMSRITLYRRMQELTGLAPTEFIRDIRLKKAAQLLAQSPDASVADVARKVGFSTPKYFSRCFKEKFGVQPSDYAPRSGTNDEQ